MGKCSLKLIEESKFLKCAYIITVLNSEGRTDSRVCHNISRNS
jgi:hypothetical protein